MKLLTTSLTAIVLAGSAMAQSAGETSIGAGFSSLGFNVEGAYRIDETYRVRGIFASGLSAEYEETENGETIEGDFELGGLALMGDFYPVQSGWRVSGGLFFSMTELTANGTTDVDGIGTVAVESSAEFANSIAPMVTTGYDLRFGDGWSFNSEIGLIFTGGVDLEVTSDDPSLQDDLDADQDIQDAIDDAAELSIYPYIGWTVSYSF